MTEITFRPTSAVASILTDDVYNQQRLNPDPRDSDYVHLSDLRLFLDSYSNRSFGTVLDYGCGGSPYRPLFKAGSYLRSDYVDCGNLDYLIGPDGKLPLPDNSCDVVLSTQVLEHVLSPRTYLSEALRVLRPGGQLILTTHGIWEDHGCPYDFRRWTYDGLCRDIQEVGFEICRAARLTTGPRAVFFLFARTVGKIHETSRSFMGWAARLLRHWMVVSPECWHRWMDRTFAENRVVVINGAGHDLYLALGIEALKPKP